MFPRASWSNLLATSPLAVIGAAGSGTAVETLKTANNATGTTGIGVLGVGLMTFDGSNFNRVTAPSGDGNFPGASVSVTPVIFNSATWDRLRSASAAANTTGAGLQGVAVMGFDGTNFQLNRLSTPTDGDPQSLNMIYVNARLGAYNSSTWDRLRNNSAANISSATQQRFLGVAEAGEWSVINAPAANTQATASKAAGGAGVRHVLRSFTASLVNSAAAAGTGTVNIRDGATGAGTIIYTFDLNVPAVANSTAIFGLSGLNIFGSANTAMTIEFAAAGGANTTEKVSMSGYSTI